MLRRSTAPLLSALFAALFAAALACRPAPARQPASTASPDAAARAEPRSPAAATPDPPPGPTPPAPEASAGPTPELLELLTAHRRPAPAPAPTPRSACGEHEATPRAESVCICEAACRRTLDREALARRAVARGRDREALARWLEGREPTTIHHPYIEIDGLRVTYDGEGRAIRCSHSVSWRAGSYAEITCPSGQAP